ncbi:MAG: phosphate ABC transporter permease subunit PstC [Kineosporiaceae bacterium]
MSSRSHVPESAAKVLLGLCAAVTLVTTVGIVIVLFEEAITLFAIPGVSLLEFFTDDAWRPFTGPESEAFRLGVLPLLNSTLLITGIALLVAIPFGLASAIYLSEYARPQVRRTVKPILELLAGMPTIVLGYFALTLVTPFLQGVFGQDLVPIFNAFSAGIVVGVLLVPTVASISEDAMTAVPRDLRNAAYGLGATKRHVSLRVVFPAALSGIVSACLLAFGAAIGETMIVSVAAGNLPPVDVPTANPFQQVQTMTAYIVQAIGGESPRGSVVYQSLFAVGALLFILTFTVNYIAMRLARRFREAY